MSDTWDFVIIWNTTDSYGVLHVCEVILFLYKIIIYTQTSSNNLPLSEKKRLIFTHDSINFYWQFVRYITVLQHEP